MDLGRIFVDLLRCSTYFCIVSRRNLHDMFQPFSSFFLSKKRTSEQANRQTSQHGQANNAPILFLSILSYVNFSADSEFDVETIIALFFDGFWSNPILTFAEHLYHLPFIQFPLMNHFDHPLMNHFEHRSYTSSPNKRFWATWQTRMLLATNISSPKRKFMPKHLAVYVLFVTQTWCF